MGGEGGRAGRAGRAGLLVCSGGEGAAVVRVQVRVRFAPHSAPSRNSNFGCLIA